MWNCPRCTYENPTHRFNCIQCGLGRNEQPMTAESGGVATATVKRSKIPMIVGALVASAAVALGSHFALGILRGAPSSLKYSSASVTPSVTGFSSEGKVTAKFPWEPEVKNDSASGISMTMYQASKGDFGYAMLYAELPSYVTDSMDDQTRTEMFEAGLQGGTGNLDDGKTISKEESMYKGDHVMTAIISGSVSDYGLKSDHGFIKVQMRLHNNIFTVTGVASKDKNFPLYDKFVDSVTFK